MHVESYHGSGRTWQHAVFVRHHAKYRADRSSRFRDMTIFRFLNMAAVRHLVFLKVRNCNCQYPLEGQYPSYWQILGTLVKPLSR